jgi:hypothetical protein
MATTEAIKPSLRIISTDKMSWLSKIFRKIKIPAA